MRPELAPKNLHAAGRTWKFLLPFAIVTLLLLSWSAFAGHAVGQEPSSAVKPDEQSS